MPELPLGPTDRFVWFELEWEGERKQRCEQLNRGTVEDQCSTPGNFRQIFSRKASEASGQLRAFPNDPLTWADDFDT
jgi:hypothetical protein